MNRDSRQGIIASLPILKVQFADDKIPLHGFRFEQSSSYDISYFFARNFSLDFDLFTKLCVAMMIKKIGYLPIIGLERRQ